MKRHQALFVAVATLLFSGCGNEASDPASAPRPAAEAPQPVKTPETTSAGSSPSADFSTPEPGERLLAAPPEGWKEAFASRAAKLRMAEYIPADESNDSWTRKITFESSSAKPLPDPLDFVSGISQDQEGTCEGFESFSTFSGLENGYPTTVHLLVCRHIQLIEKSQVTMLKAIQGAEQFYVITRAQRGPPLEEGAEAISAEVIAAWSLYLRAITVCDSERPEHPCPG